MLVVIDGPKGQYYGAQVAAPVFAKLARRILTCNGVPPDDLTTIKAPAAPRASVSAR
jgi:cell division protein FtsI (penicillin-binding protein 3)/stage V sporulation protein D (sporulation-specific penicillin-binding protein)